MLDVTSPFFLDAPHLYGRPSSRPFHLREEPIFPSSTHRTAELRRREAEDLRARSAYEAEMERRMQQQWRAGALHRLRQQRELELEQELEERRRWQAAKEARHQEQLMQQRLMLQQQRHQQEQQQLEFIRQRKRELEERGRTQAAHHAAAARQQRRLSADQPPPRRRQNTGAAEEEQHQPLWPLVRGRPDGALYRVRHDRGGRGAGTAVRPPPTGGTDLGRPPASGRKRAKEKAAPKKKAIAVTVVVEDASDSECEDDSRSPWRNRRPGPGQWIEPVELESSPSPSGPLRGDPR